MKMVGIKTELGRTDKTRDNKMSRDVIEMEKSLSRGTNHSLNDHHEGKETGQLHWLRDKIPSLNQKQAVPPYSIEGTLCFQTCFASYEAEEELCSPLGVHSRNCPA